jgi:hypothetical protein
MFLENAADTRNDGGPGGWYQQRAECPMIEPELRGDAKWLPASQPLGGGYENFFFHADVTKKPGSKLSIRSLIDMVGKSHSLLEQRFKSPVVFHKKICDRSCLFVLSWLHSLPLIMPSYHPLSQN